MSPKYSVITWDYKEQPDWDHINFALVEVSNGRIHPVDTQTDQFAIVISDMQDTAKEAQEKYEEWLLDQTTNPL